MVMTLVRWRYFLLDENLNILELLYIRQPLHPHRLLRRLFRRLFRRLGHYWLLVMAATVDCTPRHFSDAFSPQNEFARNLALPVSQNGVFNQERIQGKQQVVSAYMLT